MGRVALRSMDIREHGISIWPPFGDERAVSPQVSNETILTIMHAITPLTRSVPCSKRTGRLDQDRLIEHQNDFKPMILYTRKIISWIQPEKVQYCV